MKTRIGFVSNSSSSSFIVGFEKVPETLGQMYDTMFPDGKKYVVNYDDGMPAFEVADRVLRDLRDIEPITTFEQFLEVVKSGWFPGVPDDNAYAPLHALDGEYRVKYGMKAEIKDHEDWKAEHDALLESCRESSRRAWDDAARKFAEPEWEKLKALVVYVFSYHDDSGEGVLEHGEIFASLQHVVISHH